MSLKKTQIGNSFKLLKDNTQFLSKNNTNLQLNEMMKTIPNLKTEFGKEMQILKKTLKLKWSVVEKLNNPIRKHTGNLTNRMDKIQCRLSGLEDKVEECEKIKTHERIKQELKTIL